MLGDEKMIKEAKIWIQGAIGSQREDGWFGPRANIASPRKHSHGTPCSSKNFLPATRIASLRSFWKA